MGLLRFLLALAVLGTHSPQVAGLHLPHGDVAVQAFFIISGFYMSAILLEKYKGPSSYGLFLTNRLLRIFPTYVLVLAATVIFAWITRGDPASDHNAWMRDWGRLNGASRVAMFIVNLGVFGQDGVMFLAVDPERGSLYPTGNFWAAPEPAMRWLAAPQAWSVAMELTFYLIAPFLLRRRTRLLIGILIASEAIRGLLALSGRYDDPWSYRFLPSEIGTFLSGALAYRMYRWLLGADQIARTGAVLVTGAVLAFVAEYNLIPLSHKRLLLLPALSASMPAMFWLTKDLRWDRFVGDLSYPFYIVHWFVLGIFGHFRSHPSGGLLALATVAAALLLLKFVDRPIEAIRQRRVHISRKLPRNEPLSATASL